MSAWDFFEHLIAVAAGRKIGCLPEVFLGEIGEPTIKGNRLLVNDAASTLRGFLLGRDHISVLVADSCLGPFGDGLNLSPGGRSCQQEKRRERLHNFWNRTLCRAAKASFAAACVSAPRNHAQPDDLGRQQ
jgi:hypothetical protein